MANTYGAPHNFFARESVTVGAASVGLTQATYEPTDAAAQRFGVAQYALITVETDQVRIRFEGGDADASGHLYNSGATVELHGIANIRAIRFLRVTADATIRVSYARPALGS